MQQKIGLLLDLCEEPMLLADSQPPLPLLAACLLQNDMAAFFQMGSLMQKCNVPGDPRINEYFFAVRPALDIDSR